MKTSIVLATLLIGAAGAATASAQAQSSRYKVELHEAKRDSSFKVVSLRDETLGRNLWTREMLYPKITWSQNKRAVAVEDITHFLVWREGQPLRDFGVPRNWDYTMGCLWSPDNKRLLVRFGLSGMSDVDAGRLFCLKLGRGKSYNYAHIAGTVREMKWRDRETVSYRVLDESLALSPTWHRWRAR